MTREQALWASKHDWWLCTIIGSTGECVVVVRDWDDGGKEIEIGFRDYRKLRAWAGY